MNQPCTRIVCFWLESKFLNQKWTVPSMALDTNIKRTDGWTELQKLSLKLVDTSWHDLLSVTLSIHSFMGKVCRVGWRRLQGPPTSCCVQCNPLERESRHCLSNSEVREVGVQRSGGGCIGQPWDANGDEEVVGKGGLMCGQLLNNHIWESQPVRCQDTWCLPGYRMHMVSWGRQRACFLVYVAICILDDEEEG